MTAQDLLDVYQPVSRVFHRRPSAWLKLVLIAAAGETGVKLSDLPRSDRNPQSSGNNLNMVRRWEAAGLVTTRLLYRPTGRGRAPLLISATPKAYQLLRLTPPREASLSSSS